MNRVDVLIVNPPSPDGEIYIRDICRWGRKSREGMIWPQTSLAYIAAMVPEDLTVEIIDAIAERIDWKKFEEQIREKKPSIYVSYVTGTTFDMDARGIEAAKNAGALTVAIGTHPSAVPRDTLERIPGLDCVIRHEPEVTFGEIIERLKGGAAVDDCPGTAVRKKNGAIAVNVDRPLLESLDSLPVPAHHLLPLDRYYMPFLGRRYVWVLTNRGCPHRCSFCFEGVVWGKSVRLRTPEHIVRELILLDRLDVHNILFMADLFTYDRKYVLLLCDLIIKQGLNIRWVCNSRVDTIDREMAVKMKAAGCWLVAFGIESGSQSVLDACRKGAKVESARTAIEMMDSVGIKTWGYFILGLPEETQSTLLETIALSKSLPLDIALFHTAVPYPGTQFYFQSIDEGWLTTVDWSDFDMNDSVVVSYPQLDKQVILKYVKRAYREFYLRPGQIWRLLKMLSSSKDFLLLLKIARGFLSWLLSAMGDAHVESKKKTGAAGFQRECDAVVETTHAQKKNAKLERSKRKLPPDLK